MLGGRWEGMRPAGPQLEVLRAKLRNGERAISTEDVEALLEFSRRVQLVRQDIGERRELKLMRHLTKAAEDVGGLARALEDREAVEDLVRWIHANYDNPETNRDYRVALRVFGARMTTGDGPPASIAWVSSTTPRNYDPTPNPADMLDWSEDVEPMLEATMNSRDAATIAIAFDAGPRPGELYDLALGDISDGDYGLRIQLDGKEGQRPVALIPSVPYVNRWLADHPASEDPEAPFFSKLSSSERPSYKMFGKAFKEAGRRAGVEKPVTPSNFRTSNATWLARNGATESDINRRQGRAPGSPKIARYVAMFGPEGEEARYAELMGLDVETEADRTQRIAPLACPRCGEDTPRGKDRCVWCGQLLEYSAEQSQREDQAEVRRAFLSVARERPELLDDLDRVMELMGVVEENPELLEDARRFVDATD